MLSTISFTQIIITKEILDDGQDKISYYLKNINNEKIKRANIAIQIDYYSHDDRRRIFFFSPKSTN